MNRKSCIAGAISVLSLMFAALLACSETASPPLPQASVNSTPTSEALPAPLSPTVVPDIPISETLPTSPSRTVVPDTPTSEPAPTATIVVKPTVTLNRAPDVTEVDIRLAPDGGFNLELLEFMPDNLVTRGLVWMQDFGSWWSGLESVGFERPGPDAPTDWMGEMFALKSTLSLFRSGPWVQTPLICCPRMYLNNSHPYPYVGFDFRNADQTLMIEQGPIVYEVARGDYDADVTAARLDACNECIEHEV